MISRVINFLTTSEYPKQKTLKEIKLFAIFPKLWWWIAKKLKLLTEKVI